MRKTDPSVLTTSIRTSTTTVGFRFSPNRDELVAFLLFNRTHGDPSLCNGLIMDYDLYGQEESWQIWDQFGGDSHQDLYFFTQLKKKTPKASRFDCRVRNGKGTWHGDDGALEFQAQFRGISVPACRRRFNYRNRSSDHYGYWIIHEFSSPSLSNTTVVCILRKKEQHVDSRKRKPSEPNDPVELEPKRTRFQPSETSFPIIPIMRLPPTVASERADFDFLHFDFLDVDDAVVGQFLTNICNESQHIADDYSSGSSSFTYVDYDNAFVTAQFLTDISNEFQQIPDDYSCDFPSSFNYIDYDNASVAGQFLTDISNEFQQIPAAVSETDVYSWASPSSLTYIDDNNAFIDASNGTIGVHNFSQIQSFSMPSLLQAHSIH